MTWTAVYVDAAGIAFSCPIAKVGNNFVLATQDGPKPISYYITGADLAGGYATFHTYRIDGMPNLRGCDVIALIDRMNQTLPHPQRPVDPPKQTEPEDTRIHLEQRQPGQSSFAQLKEAAHRAGELARAARERERREMLEKANQHDPRKVQQARNTNNYLAAQMRPKRNTGE